MNGRRLLLDTNAIVALLQGNPQVLKLTSEIEWIGISIISHIEFLCFSGLAQPDRDLFAKFLGRVETIGLHSGEPQLIEQAVEIRRIFRIKLPDAIVAASALIHNAVLVTADQKFSSIKDLPILSF
jgi:tRNA(fMet)-specific endonuclease VapC